QASQHSGRSSSEHCARSRITAHALSAPASRGSILASRNISTDFSLASTRNSSTGITGSIREIAPRRRTSLKSTRWWTYFLRVSEASTNPLFCWRMLCEQSRQSLARKRIDYEQMSRGWARVHWKLLGRRVDVAQRAGKSVWRARQVSAAAIGRELSLT